MKKKTVASSKRWYSILPTCCILLQSSLDKFMLLIHTITDDPNVFQIISLLNNCSTVLSGYGKRYRSVFEESADLTDLAKRYYFADDK